MSNQQYFDADNYEDATPIKKEAELKFYEIPYSPQTRFLSVKMNHLEREDNLLYSLTGITSIEEEFFTIDDNNFIVERSSLQYH